MIDKKILESIEKSYKDQMAKNKCAAVWCKVEIDGEEAWISLSDKVSASFFMNLLKEAGAEMDTAEIGDKGLN